MSAVRIGDPRAPSTIGLLAAGTLLLMVAAVIVIGPVGLVTPLAVCAMLASLRWPAIAVAGAVVPSILFELSLGDDYAPGAFFYLPGTGVSPSEFAVAFAVGVVALDCLRRRSLPPVPAPLVVALGLMVVAIAIGTVVGYYGGAGLGPQLDGIRNVVPLVVGIPLVAAVMPDAARLRPVVGLAAALIVVKALLGLAQQAQFGSIGITSIVYFEPTTNWLFVLYLVVLAACRLQRVPVPWWVWAAAPLVAFEFVVGLKRSLWIGLVAGLALVITLGVSRLGRRLAVPAVLAVGAALWLLAGAGFGDQLQGPVAERIESLRPSALTANRADRYRLDERANVWIAVRQQPLTGLGQGVDWKAVRPLGIEYSDLRGYVHFAPMWFWMKYSLVGLAAYLALLGASVWLGLAVFRRQADPLLRAVGLGYAGAIVAIGVAELTVTWTGASPRFTLVVSAATGVVCAMLPARAASSPAAAQQRADVVAIDGP